MSNSMNNVKNETKKIKKRYFTQKFPAWSMVSEIKKTTYLKHKRGKWDIFFYIYIIIYVCIIPYRVGHTFERKKGGDTHFERGDNLMINRS